MVARATRQPKWSASALMPMRPAMPPKAVPPIYRPMENPSPRGWMWFDKYAMATAGTPPSNRPSSARAASSAPQVGATAASTLHRAASAIDANIRRRWSRPSDSAPATKIATARQPVVTESASELPAAPRPKYAASSGSTGCTQYSSEKVAKPARKSARLMRR